jgi:hypothetical protein
MADSLDELANKAWFEVLLMFENSKKFTVDFYLPGESKGGEAVATFEMVLTGPDTGTFALKGKYDYDKG